MTARSLRRGVAACAAAFMLLLGTEPGSGASDEESLAANIVNKGPGLPNLAYSVDGATRAWFKDTSLAGAKRNHGTAAMHFGYLFSPYAKDGTSGDDLGFGGIAFWDVSGISNASIPAVVKRVNRIDDDNLRESHSPVFSNSFRGFNGSAYVPKRMVALQDRNGFQLWDVTNPKAPGGTDGFRKLADVVLPDVNGDSYNRSNFWHTWAGRYVYVAGSQEGLFVVDVSPIGIGGVPVLKSRRGTTRSSTSRDATFWCEGGNAAGPCLDQISQVFVLGRTAIVFDGVDEGRIATIDLSDPANPTRLHVYRVENSYSIQVFAGKIALFGKDGKLYIYNYSDPSGVISKAGASTATFGATGFKGGGYGTYQRNGANVRLAGGWSLRTIRHNLSVAGFPALDTWQAPGCMGNRDDDFAVFFGNLIWTGNDHEDAFSSKTGACTGLNGTEAALWNATLGKKIGAPEVERISPANDIVTAVSRKTLIGVHFADQIDLETINPRTFEVKNSAGVVVTGDYSSGQNFVYFQPSAALNAGSVYTVTIKGVKDWVGNELVTPFVSRFKTGL